MEELFTSVATSSELAHKGYSSAALTRACQAGQLIRFRYNSYTTADLWRSWDQVTRCKAHHVGVLKNSNNYVLSHSSAALWWGAPLLTLPQKVWVSTSGEGARSRGLIKVSGGRPDVCENSVFHEGAMLTDPLQTVLDCARVLPLLDALCVADFMLHQRHVPASDLEKSLKVTVGRGARTARGLAELMSGAAESPAETIARYRIAQWGFARPREQAELVCEGRLYRPDFLWEEEKVILEVDGEVKYDGTYGDSREVIQREHRRQRAIEHLGYRVVRVRWRDLMDRPQRVRQWLLDAGLAPG